MSDLIRREDALDLFSIASCEKELIYLLKNLPAVDAVEVVRCRECEFRYYAPDGSGHCRKKLGDWFTDDGFCSDGLPKEGGGEK